MPTQDQIVDIPLTGGLNTKKDGKLIAANEMSVLSNAVYRKDGRVNKVSGFDNLIETDCDGNDIEELNFTTNFKEELIGLSENSSYSYTENVGWNRIGDFASADISSETIVQGDESFTIYDQLTADGIRFISYLDESGDCFWLVKSTSGSTIISPEQISGVNPVERQRFRLVNRTVFIVYYYSNGLYYRTASLDDPCTLSDEIQITNDAADNDFDINDFDNIVYVAHKNNSGGFLSISAFNILTTPSTVILEDGGGSDIAANDNIKLIIIPQGGVDANLLFAYSAGGSFFCSSFDIDFNIISENTLTGTATANAQNLLIEFNGSVYHLFDTPNATDRLFSISRNILDDEGVEQSFIAQWIGSVGLASQGYKTDNNWYFNARYGSDLQPAEFVINGDGRIVAKILQDSAADLSREQLPKVTEWDNIFYFGTGNRGRLQSEGGDLLSDLGVTAGEIEFDIPFKSVDTGENLLIAAGLLSSYDRLSFTELGFNIFPELVTPSGGAGAACFFTALYRWTDSAGRIHRSAPAIPVEGNIDDTAAIVQALRLTSKEGVVIELYRTVASATANDTFYKTAEAQNDPLADTVNLAFVAESDADLVSNEIIYTAGGILPNIAPRSATSATTYRNRVFTSGLGDGNLLQYSKIIRQGEGVAFADDYFARVDARGGDIATIEAMDAYLIIFKRDNIYQLQGDGPDDNGAGGTFTEPQLITSDVGCISLRSVVSGPQGLYFQSAKGIYLLGRNLEVTYIGAPVEDFVQGNIVTSAVLLDDQNEIRFTLNDQILIYNYYYGRWSSIGIDGATSSAVWQTNYVAIKDGKGITSIPEFRRFGAFYGMDITTGWLKLSSIQGFQRVKRLFILGERKSNHKLKVSFYTDYSDTVVQEVILDSDLGQPYYGEGLYGETTPYGGTESEVYQFDIHVKVQKCQTLRVRIQDMFDNRSDIGTGEALNLIGFSARIGMKQGGPKLATVRKGG